MRILKLKLRGAIGIKKGLGLDEIEIDFSQFKPGLIALTGRNGSGKTTIIENLHPYRQMVSRDGSLQNHFFLKDSYRILEFELDGDNYESKILIDALTGGSEAYLFKNGKPLNDGKVSTYDNVIEELLGSPELFFNSVFSAQKSKGISELKPADRRKLFYELLNLNNYEIYLENAKNKLKIAENEYSRIEGEILALTNDNNDLESLENSRKENLNYQAQLISEVTDIENDIENLNSAIKENEISLHLLNQKISVNEEIQSEIKKLEKQIYELTNQHNTYISKLNSEIEEQNKKLDRFKKLTTEEARQKIENAINNKAELNEKLLNLKSQHSDLIKDYSQKQNELQSQKNLITEKESKLNSIKSELKLQNVKLQNLEKELYDCISQSKTITTVPCDESIGSKCKFLINAYQSKMSIPELNNKINTQKEVIEKLEASFKKLTEELNYMSSVYISLKSCIDEEFNEVIKRLESEIKTTESSLSQLNEYNWEKLRDEINDAEKNISIIKESLKNLEDNKAREISKFESNVTKIKSDIEQLKKKIDYQIEEKIAKVNSNLVMLKQILTGHNQTLLSSKARLEEAKTELAKIEQQIEQIKLNTKKISELNSKKELIAQEIRDWSFLCKAFDKTGIPVLKLENSGIEITSIANDLLSIFDNKFRIVFETMKLKADKKSYKESFDINIVEDDGITDIANKSGGQQVWLETAIQLAISLVVRNQGRNIKTAFLDEKDGALDLENAFNYIEMLRKAHEMSGVFNTFIITHRPELLDYIPQQIKLNDGYLEIICN